MNEIAIIGAFNAVGTILLFIGNSPVISGAESVLLGQIMIPITMMLSIVLMGRRYKVILYVAVILILFGVLVSVSPSLFLSTVSTRSSIDIFYPITLFSFGIFFLAASNVFSEILLGKNINDIIKFWALVCTFQFFIQILLAPLAYPLQGMSFNMAFENTKEGLYCLFIDTTDICKGSLTTFIIYQCINSAYNLGAIFVIVQTSASWLNVASTIALPLSNLLFSMPLVMGASLAQPLTVSDWFSLCFVVAGVILYNYNDNNNNVKFDEDEISSFGNISNVEQELYAGEKTPLVSRSDNI
jgi:hypothetical protein